MFRPNPFSSLSTRARRRSGAIASFPSLWDRPTARRTRTTTPLRQIVAADREATFAEAADLRLAA